MALILSPSLYPMDERGARLRVAPMACEALEAHSCVGNQDPVDHSESFHHLV